MHSLPNLWVSENVYSYEIIPLYDTGIVTWWGTAGDE